MVPAWNQQPGVLGIGDGQSAVGHQIARAIDACIFGITEPVVPEEEITAASLPAIDGDRDGGWGAMGRL